MVDTMIVPRNGSITFVRASSTSPEIHAPLPHDEHEELGYAGRGGVCRLAFLSRSMRFVISQSAIRHSGDGGWLI